MPWSGLADFLRAHDFDYLIGCASIDLADGGIEARKIVDRLRARHLAPESLRVTPRLPMPTELLPTEVDSGGNGHPGREPRMPPLLKAYVRLGARACGEPCWDPEFNVADIFILLDLAHLGSRYQRHFRERAARRGAG